MIFSVYRLDDGGRVLLAEGVDIKTAAMVYERDKAEHKGTGYAIERVEDDDSIAE